MFETVRLPLKNKPADQQNRWWCYFVTYEWQKRGLDRGLANAEVYKEGGPISRAEDIVEMCKKLKSGVPGAGVTVIVSIFHLRTSPAE